MALDATARRDAARELANRMFAATTADLDLDNLASAVGGIDDAMDTVISTITPQTGTVKQFLVQSLPEPFKSNSSANEKAVALMVWAMKEVGII